VREIKELLALADDIRRPSFKHFEQKCSKCLKLGLLILLDSANNRAVVPMER